MTQAEPHSDKDQGVRIKDLITLPRIKSVIQMSDADDPALQSRLVDSFILTEEVLPALRVILEHILSGSGGGFFLKGHYGSGKSHFLAYLNLILSHKRYFQAFLDQFQRTADSPSLTVGGVAKLRPMVVTLSLVDFRAETNLEDALLSRLVHTFSELSPEFEALTHAREPDAQAGRSAYLEQLFQFLKRQQRDGLVILIDELSEFLRSKPSVARFNEDIRYLQFLGEASSNFPLWVVAALQEHLEETGEIQQELFNKIKDRYPVRIHLTSAHVKSLVTQLLVQKQPGARAIIRSFYKSLKDCFPDWPVGQDEFEDLYPVHPATIDLLENLKPLFSKTRGIVDFIHYQISGDSDRGIPGMLELPPQNLLRPDRIFDHFLDKLRSSIELLPYLETVYAYYQREMAGLFKEDGDRSFAFRLLKLLILQEIAPARFCFTVRELTEMLQERITDLEPELNYRYTFDIADEMARRGNFVAPESSQPESVELSSRRFRIQLEANVVGIVERKLEYRKTMLRPLGRQIIARLMPYLIGRVGFFEGMLPGKSEMLVVDWQNTRRTGLLTVSASNLQSLSASQDETRNQEFRPTNVDDEGEFRLVVLLPEEQIPALALPGSGSDSEAFLQPAAITGLEECLAALSLFELSREYEADQSAQGARIRRHLESLIENQLGSVAEQYQRAYRSAVLLTRQGEILCEFEDAGRATLREILQDAAAKLLESRYPKHYVIAPHQSFYPPAALKEVADYFQTMDAEAFQRLSWGRTVLEGFLLPTGILSRKGKEYRFAGIEESQPLQLLAQQVRESQGLSARRALAVLAGPPFGMCEAQCKAFLLASLYGGFLQARKEGRKVPLHQISAERILELPELVAGETISSQTAQFLMQLAFIPRRFRKETLSYSECGRCWETVVSTSGQLSSRLEQLESLLSRYREYKAFARLNMEGAGQALQDIRQLLDSIHSSFTPIDGLEAMARKAPDPSRLNRSFQTFESLFDFFTRSFGGYSFIWNYLEEARQSLPPTTQQSALAEELAQFQQLLQSWQPMLGSEPFQALLDRFDAWHQAYMAAYEKEHREFYQQPAFEQLRGLQQSFSLSLLIRLERLPGFVPMKSSSRIRSALSEVLQGQCLRSVWEELRQRPRCACGFSLGASPDPPSPDRIEKEIEEQLKLFLIQIRHPRFGELFERFEFQLSRVGGKEPEAGFQKTVRRLREIKTVEQLLELENELTVALLDRLSAFEPGRKPFRVKYFRDFREAVGNQPLSRRALVEKFDAWLARDGTSPEEPVLLAEQERESSLDGLEAHLAAMVHSRFPELLEDLQRFTLEEFVFRLLASSLVVGYRLDPKKAASRLTLLPSDPVQLEKYSRLATQLWQEEGDLLRVHIERFEARLESSAYQQLGVLPEGEKELAGLVATEPLFAGLVRRASQRLAKKLIHSQPRAVSTIIKELQHVQAGQAGKVRQQMVQCRRFLSTLCRILQARHKLDHELESDSAASFRSLLNLYLETISLLPYQLDQLAVYRRETELLESGLLLSLRQGVETPLKVFCDRFSAGVQENLEKLPRVAGVIEKATAQLGADLQISARRLVFADGLSWPLWLVTASELEKSLPARIRILKTASAFAFEPSNTHEQLQRWLESGGPKPGATLQKGFSFRHREDDGLFSKLAWIDEKIHTSRESPYFLYQEISRQLAAQMLTLLGRLAAGELLILFSDHGFTENDAFDEQDKYRAPRYRHGGGSPFELLVPVVFFYSGPADQSPAGRIPAS